MEFVKVLTRLRDNPRWLGVSFEAKGVWTDVLLYCGDRETEGFVAAAVARRWPETAIAELVDVGLLERVRDGLAVHDFGDHNSADVLDQAEKRAQWKTRQQKRRALLRESAASVTPELKGVTSDLENVTVTRDNVTVTRDVTQVSRQDARAEDQRRPDQRRPESPKPPRGLLAQALELWNTHKHPAQPAANSIAGTRERNLRSFLAEIGNDLAVWTRCVQAFAASPMHNGTGDGKTWGLDTMTRPSHRAKWVDAGREPARAALSPDDEMRAHLRDVERQNARFAPLPAEARR